MGGAVGVSTPLTFSLLGHTSTLAHFISLTFVRAFQQLRKIRGFPTPSRCEDPSPRPPAPTGSSTPHKPQPTSPLPGLEGPTRCRRFCLRAPGFKTVNWSSEGFIERLSSDPQAYTWNGLRLQPAFPKRSQVKTRPPRSLSNPLAWQHF